MKTTKITAAEKRNLDRVVMEELATPYKVQKAINQKLDRVLDSGLTVAETLRKCGVTGKLTFNDLYQIDTENGKKVCVLKRYCKRMTNDIPYKYGLNLVAIGKYWYRSIPAALTVPAYIESLQSMDMINKERQKAVDMYDTLFERAIKDFAKVVKRVKEEKERKKAERKKNIRSFIKGLESTEVYRNAHFITITKEAIKMVKLMVAA